MAKSSNTKTPSGRENLLSRARERFPDRTFADLDATGPVEGAADLDEAISEMLEDYRTRQATYDEHNGQLRDLFVNDPDAAEFVQRWMETGDPRTALVETFGDDLGINEEGRTKFKEQLDGWRKRRDESAQADATAEKNYNEVSLPALEAWGDEKGLTLEQKRDVMVRLIEIGLRGVFEGLYTREDFDLAWNAINHDKDVNAARAEGEVAGRNQKISAARRDRAAAGALPPAPTGRQGGSMGQPKPAKRSFWGEVNNG